MFSYKELRQYKKNISSFILGISNSQLMYDIATQQVKVKNYHKAYDHYQQAALYAPNRKILADYLFDAWSMLVEAPILKEKLADFKNFVHRCLLRRTKYKSELWRCYLMIGCKFLKDNHPQEANVYFHRCLVRIAGTTAVILDTEDYQDRDTFFQLINQLSTGLYRKKNKKSIRVKSYWQLTQFNCTLMDYLDHMANSTKQDDIKHAYWKNKRDHYSEKIERDFETDCSRNSIQIFKEIKPSVWEQYNNYKNKVLKASDLEQLTQYLFDAWCFLSKCPNSTQEEKQFKPFTYKCLLQLYKKDKKKSPIWQGYLAIGCKFLEELVPYEANVYLYRSLVSLNRTNVMAESPEKYQNKDVFFRLIKELDTTLYRNKKYQQNIQLYKALLIYITNNLTHKIQKDKLFWQEKHKRCQNRLIMLARKTP